MNSAEELHYDDQIIEFLELMWGKGYLSPGGAEEIGRLLEGVSLAGKTVLDIGCGSGGITAALARDYGAGKVIGIDVEEPGCRRARQSAEDAGVADRIEIKKISPGFPMDFTDQSFEIVFSKDSIVHIADKEALAEEVFRLLVPGGWFVASDWMISHDGEPSRNMADYLRAEDLDFGMASPERYQTALESAGFSQVSLNNRNPWYAPIAEQELERLAGSQRDQFDAILGKAAVDAQIETWTAMVKVLRSGEHCPHHFRCQKPVRISD